MYAKIIDFGLSHTYLKTHENEEQKLDDRNLPDFLKNEKHIEN
jgi:hypothetical protein